MTQEQNQVTDSGREIETLKRSNPFKDKLGETMPEGHGMVGWVGV